jgi:hypothetical protein
MTVTVVPADPPRAGLVLPEVTDETPLSADAAADLYRAALQDVLRVAEQVGGRLLVNYRSADHLPDEYATDTDPEAEVRAVAGEALQDVTDARFEPQVGSTVSARLGNTVTHLLREEDAPSVSVVWPTAPLVRRSTIDGASMKLRHNEVVLGPTHAGRAFLAGFTEPVDFAGAFGDGELETLARRGHDADCDVEFIHTSPRLDQPGGLASLVPLLRSRVIAERVVPAETATFVHERGVTVRDGEVVVDE